MVFLKSRKVKVLPALCFPSTDAEAVMRGMPVGLTVIYLDR